MQLKHTSKKYRTNKNTKTTPQFKRKTQQPKQQIIKTLTQPPSNQNHKIAPNKAEGKANTKIKQTLKTKQEITKQNPQNFCLIQTQTPKLSSQNPKHQTQTQTIK